MTKQYNVNIVGNLTNDNGILSGFSVNDYATLPETLENLTISSLEIVFKFKINTATSYGAIFWTDKLIDVPLTPWAGLRLCNYNNDNMGFDLEITDDNAQIVDIYDTTVILPNAYYYIKALYNNTDGYSLYKSEDGETYTLVGTSATTTMPPNSQAIIGRAVDIDPMPLDGSIDLNESYIKVNNVIWWRGVENITKIQLRHDTAANWTSVNPVLLEGEVGIETDTRKQKFGDGVTAWSSLPYDKGSTALQSITSSDVTTALGYTPVDRSLSNLDSAGQDKFDAKVNKAGDTMTGNLNFTTSSSNPNIRQVTTLSDATLGTLPSVDYYNGFQTKDSQGTEFANVNCSYNRNGRIGSNFYITRNDGGSTVSGFMGVFIDQGGTEAYSTFSNTKCVDGQWVNNSGQLASDVSLAIGNDQRLEYNISSYLPNDNYSYEVRFSIDAQTGSGSGAGLSMSLIGKAYNNVDTWVRVCNMYARGSWAMVVGNSAIVPIGTDRKVKLNYTVISKAAQLTGLHIEAFRRIGTNA